MGYRFYDQTWVLNMKHLLSHSEEVKCVSVNQHWIRLTWELRVNVYQSTPSTEDVTLEPSSVDYYLRRDQISWLSSTCLYQRWIRSLCPSHISYKALFKIKSLRFPSRLILVSRLFTLSICSTDSLRLAMKVAFDDGVFLCASCLNVEQHGRQKEFALHHTAQCLHNMLFMPLEQAIHQL